MDNRELYHYGVPGMKWGVRRERKRLDKKLNKPTRTGFGPKQNKVLSKRNGALVRDKTYNDKWAAAFKAGKGSKEWAEFEDYRKEFSKKYVDQYIDAWLSDNRIKKLSEQGRKYVEEKLAFK